MTELEIVTEVRPVQLWNARRPIVVTELEIVKEVRPVQLWNALVSIVVTLHIIPLGSVIVLGIVITPVADELIVIVASVTLVL